MSVTVTYDPKLPPAHETHLRERVAQTVQLAAQRLRDPDRVVLNRVDLYETPDGAERWTNPLHLDPDPHSAACQTCRACVVGHISLAVAELFGDDDVALTAAQIAQDPIAVEFTGGRITADQAADELDELAAYIRRTTAQGIPA